MESECPQKIEKKTEEITTEMVTTEEVVNNVLISQDQALNGVVKYCYSKENSLRDISPEDYSYYWNVDGLSNGEYVVTYRSYTGAIIYYHVNTSNGDVYTTEYVPGITDGEVEGSEYYNIYDYLD